MSLQSDVLPPLQEAPVDIKEKEDAFFEIATGLAPSSVPVETVKETVDQYLKLQGLTENAGKAGVFDEYDKKEVNTTRQRAAIEFEAAFEAAMAQASPSFRLHRNTEPYADWQSWPSADPMGITVSARRPPHDPSVVVKRLNFPSDPAQKASSQRECSFCLDGSWDLLKDLFPSFVSLEFVLKDDDITHAYLTTKLVEGISFAEFVEKYRSLEACKSPQLVRLLLTVLLNLVSAIAKINSLGFAHRDLHLCNIFVKKDGSITLIDCGTLRKFEDMKVAIQHSVTQFAAAANLAYTPPEKFDLQYCIIRVRAFVSRDNLPVAAQLLTDILNDLTAEEAKTLMLNRLTSHNEILDEVACRDAFALLDQLAQAEPTIETSWRIPFLRPSAFSGLKEKQKRNKKKKDKQEKNEVRKDERRKKKKEKKKAKSRDKRKQLTPAQQDGDPVADSHSLQTVASVVDPPEIDGGTLLAQAGKRKRKRQDIDIQVEPSKPQLGEDERPAKRAKKEFVARRKGPLDAAKVKHKTEIDDSSSSSSS